MANSSMLHVRVDNSLKKDATATLAEFGLTLSDAVRIFLTRVVKEGGLPTGLTTDAETYDAWFRAKVIKAIEEEGADDSHENVMSEIKGLIARKKCG